MPTPTVNPGTVIDPTSSSGATDKGGNQGAFLSTLQDTLMKQSGIISSSDSNIETGINSAIAGVKASNDASKAAIESKYNRGEGYQADVNKTAETAFMEKRTGFATPVVAFANLREYNQKSIRDLEDRKQELILQGDSAAAKTISDLQVQKLTFEQEAAQKTFENLISAGNFGLSIAAGERADRQQSFTEKSAIGAIALQYGVEVKPGDTIDTIVNRAKPFATQEEQLKLETAASTIRKNNAETRKALSDASNNAPLSEAQIVALAAASRTPYGAQIVAASVKNPGSLAAIFAQSSKLEATDVTNYVQGKIDAGQTLDKTLGDLSSDKSISIQDMNGASKIAASLYASKPAAPPKPKTDLPSQAGGAYGAYSGGVNNFLEYLTGIHSK